ncbi:TolC family protein [Sulfuriferula nivalis]|uniref:Metal transporter n=1 Tax=Sulfuriferula nivalis TaxID=2675298 RepID=A0A809RKT7_9PROT|nr:TolC family protein [Sulfuriferula nivalis]BBO99380.1 metal transporter [Sulfuriferula nivalis]
MLYAKDNAALNLLKQVTIAALLLPLSTWAADLPTYSVEQLIALGMANNQNVQAAESGVVAAQAGITSARAFPNPELEATTGKIRARQPGATEGNTVTMGLIQRLDLPNVRNARVDVAQSNVAYASSEKTVVTSEVRARIKLAYFNVLRRQEELKAAQENNRLVQEIFNRVKVRVDTGEAPRYELIKAETELLNTQRTLQAATLRVTQAKTALSREVGGALPPEFNVADYSVKRLVLAGADLKAAIANNPYLRQSQADLVRAQQQLTLERNLRTPDISLRADWDREPDINASRIGIQVTLPIWNQRQGPIDVAAAQLAQARNRYDAVDYNVKQSLITALNEYEIATTQVSALEEGVMRQAEAALKVAEAAYRFGERGILDYLDAQRVYRTTRNDLIAARYEQGAALVELERYTALNLESPAP